MWMSDEKYTYIQDCKEKKSTAASARRQRTHCGKGGSVKLPSDFKTRKELKAMNGECKSYHMSAPMTWDDFKKLPDDLKVQYIKNLRERFSVPDTALAEAMGACDGTFKRWIKCLNISSGKSAAAAGRWWHTSEKAVAFKAWWNGSEQTVESISVEPLEGVEAENVDIPNQPVEVAEESPEACEHGPNCQEKMIRDVGPIAFAGNSIPVIPKSGTMTFENNNAEDILTTLKTMLGGVRMNLTVSWEVV